MNFSEVLNGKTTFQAAGFIKTVLLSQLGFDLQRAVFKSTKKDATPVIDSRYDAAMGDTGMSESKPLNPENLCEGMAAAFTLLTRHIQTPDPETGRRPEYLLRWRKGPAEVIQAQVDWQLENAKQQTQAVAAMLGADPTTRLATVEQEIRDRVAGQVEPHVAAFVNHLTTMRDWSDDDLADTACDAMIEAGRDVAAEVKRAAKLYLESQKKRYETGGYVAIDPGIFALAQ